MAVEVDADAGPFEPRGDLFDMGRFAGAVIARHDHAAVVGEAGENGERRLFVEQVVGVKVGHVVVANRIGRTIHIRINTENLTNRNFGVRQAGRVCRRRHYSSMHTPAPERADLGAGEPARWFGAG